MTKLFNVVVAFVLLGVTAPLAFAQPTVTLSVGGRVVVTITDNEMMGMGRDLAAAAGTIHFTSGAGPRNFMLPANSSVDSVDGMIRSMMAAGGAQVELFKLSAQKTGQGNNPLVIAFGDTFMVPMGRAFVSDAIAGQLSGARMLNGDAVFFQGFVNDVRVAPPNMQVGGTTMGIRSPFPVTGSHGLLQVPTPMGQVPMVMGPPWMLRGELSIKLGVAGTFFNTETTVTPVLHVPVLKPSRAIVGITTQQAFFQALTAKAGGVGEGARDASVVVAGRFTSGEAVDLASASVILSNVLLEVAEDRELVRAGTGDPILPVLLFARPGSKANSAVYESDQQIRPTFRLELKKRDPKAGLFEFRLRVDRATITKFPSCESVPLAANLATTFVVDDNTNPLTFVSTTNPWRCVDPRNDDPLQPSRLVVP
jgi:hypothetical protein